MSFFIKVPYNPLKALLLLRCYLHQLSPPRLLLSNINFPHHNSPLVFIIVAIILIVVEVVSIVACSRKTTGKIVTVVIVLTMGKVVLTTAISSNTIGSKVIVSLHPIGGLIHSLF